MKLLLEISEGNFAKTLVPETEHDNLVGDTIHAANKNKTNHINIKVLGKYVPDGTVIDA